MLCGNGDHSANWTRLEKLEEMQGSIVTEGCLRNRSDQQCYIWGRNVGYNEATSKRDENAKVDVRSDT